MPKTISKRISDEMLDRFQKGERAAYDHTYNHTCERMYFFALQMVKNKEASEDITADTFTKLWARRDKISDCRKLVPYLYMIVRNACLDYIEKSKLKNARHNEIEYLNSDNTESDIEHDIIRAELIHEVCVALNTLPPRCGRIFQQLYFEKKSYFEIAQEMKISVKTIRAQKVRGLKLLREKLSVKSFIIVTLSATYTAVLLVKAGLNFYL